MAPAIPSISLTASMVSKTVYLPPSTFPNRPAWFCLGLLLRFSVSCGPAHADVYESRCSAFCRLKLSPLLGVETAVQAVLLEGG